MSVAEKLKQIAENEQRVYDAGIEKGVETERDTVWDMIQNYGNRTDYTSAFANAAWNDETFNPKYNIKPVGSCGQMFYATKIVDLEATLQRRGVVLDTSKAKSLNNAFNSTTLKVLPAIDVTSLSGNTAGNMVFRQNLHTIRKLICAEATVLDTPCFQYATGLVNVAFDGVIGNDLDLHPCKLLSKESVTSVINALSDTAKGKTLTMSEAAVAAAFPTEEISLDLFASEPNGTETLTVKNNGDGSFTVNGQDDTTALSFTVAEVDLVAGETYELVYESNSDATLAFPITLGGLTFGPHYLNESIVLTPQEGYTHLVMCYDDLPGTYYDNLTIRPRLRTINTEWEELKKLKIGTANDPNWTVTLM
ncbi:MAG: hypothetical protein IJW69_01505 [Clostridia bacterium]|nr:hypothetical protein [Clostridia bacterium]